jgi:outer membrane immunogenic protein
MKRLLLAAMGGVGALALASIGAAAADMPLKAPPAPPVYNWYGFYIGGTAGYAWGSNAIDLSYGPAFPAGLPATEAGNPHGFIGGLEYGTNYQFGRWVLGTESDFSFGNITSSQTSSTGAFTNSGSQKLTDLSTSRGRAGYTIQDNILLYGTAGLAEGTAKTTLSSAGAACPPCFGGSVSKTLWGWTAGAGVEYAKGPWSVKVEYLHYDLGNLNINFIDPTAPGVTASTSTRYAGEIVRAGVNYHFTWTPWDLVFGRH